MMGGIRLKPGMVWVRPKSRARCALLLAALFSVFALAGVALATDFYYVGNLGPGGYASSGGWNNRSYNRARRDDGSLGTMAVGYYNTSGGLDFWSGDVSTRCSTGNIAALENDGYFKTRCWNDGGSTFWVVCQTTP
jgi:hypothetical protein